MWLAPAEIDTTPVKVVPAAESTVTGAVAWVVVPLPSCPLAFRPQQRAVPSERRTQVCELPAVTCVAVVMPVTAVDANARPVVLPTPSCPLTLEPQQRTAPVDSNAQL